VALATAALEAGRFLLDQRAVSLAATDELARVMAPPASSFDDLDDLFGGPTVTSTAKLAAPAPGAVAVGATAVPASLPPAHVLLVARKDRLDVLLLPRGVLLFSAHTPAGVRQELLFLIDQLYVITLDSYVLCSHPFS